MALSTLQTNKAGFESQLAACHIGHFCLTALLLPELMASDGARVIALTSMGYEQSDVRLEDWNFSNGEAYDPWHADGQAKTANIMFTSELARRAAAQSIPLTALVVHPGIILESGIMQNTSPEQLEKELQRNLAKGYVPEPLKNMSQGCATIVYAAMDPSLERKSGAFLRDCRLYPESQQKPYVLDAEKAAKLWDLTESRAGLPFLSSKR